MYLIDRLANSAGLAQTEPIRPKYSGLALCNVSLVMYGLIYFDGFKCELSFSCTKFRPLNTRY